MGLRSVLQTIVPAALAVMVVLAQICQGFPVSTAFTPVRVSQATNTSTLTRQIQHGPLPEYIAYTVQDVMDLPQAVVLTWLGQV